MLRTKIGRLLADKAELFKEEREYALRTGLLRDESDIAEAGDCTRFKEAYIEVGDKETENLVAVKGPDFLDNPITYFKDHKNEFMYLESDWWDLVGVDAVSLEIDDVFGNYDVMLGIRLQKKYGNAIKSYLSENPDGNPMANDLMFDSNEGIWSLNFSLNEIKGFEDGMMIGKAYEVIYSYLFGLAEWVESNQ